jgi:hypothetical protein
VWQEVLHGPNANRFAHRPVALPGSKGDQLRGLSQSDGSAAAAAAASRRLQSTTTGLVTAAVPAASSTSTCVEYQGTVGGHWPAIDVSALTKCGEQS